MEYFGNIPLSSTYLLRSLDLVGSTRTALNIPLLLPVALYLDAKLHLVKDLSFLRRRAVLDRAIYRAAAVDRLSPYYLIERNALDPKLASKEAIWQGMSLAAYSSTLSKMSSTGRINSRIGSRRVAR